jgi:hypothetical protein
LGCNDKIIAKLPCRLSGYRDDQYRLPPVYIQAEANILSDEVGKIRRKSKPLGIKLSGDGFQNLPESRRWNISYPSQPRRSNGASLNWAGPRDGPARGEWGGRHAPGLTIPLTR